MDSPGRDYEQQYRETIEQQQLREKQARRPGSSYEVGAA